MSVLKNDSLARAESGDFIDDCIEVIISYVATAAIVFIAIGLTQGKWNQLGLSAIWGLALFTPAWLTLRLLGVFDWFRNI